MVNVFPEYFNEYYPDYGDKVWWTESYVEKVSKIMRDKRMMIHAALLFPEFSEVIHKSYF